MKHDSGREVIARGIIIHERAVLVNFSRNKKTGEQYCALPGGHVDPGESCAEALRRELQEELGCDAQVGALCFVAESIYAGRKASDKMRHELVLYFATTLLQLPPTEAGRILSPEADKNFRWLPLSDLEAANLLPPNAKQSLLQLVSNGSVAAYYSFNDSTQ
ncbi:MAG TPA: NUDIX domain-containing protein [Abditibacteriaceae bacterium]|jgi:ADP-ribose pyrophosphatase YjhB (NUDIX family)